MEFSLKSCFLSRNRFLYRNFRTVLEKSCKPKTSFDDKMSTPTYGHCYLISRLVNKIFDNVETYNVEVKGDSHWFYKVRGDYYDFTSDQYGGNGLKPKNDWIEKSKKQNLLPQVCDRFNEFYKCFLKQSKKFMNFP